MKYFLLKTEPSTFSLDDLKADKKTSWSGVRNYQARNILRDDMNVGDLCIIYHSSCAVPAAVGVGRVVKSAYPDPLQFDHKSEYYDPASPIGNPRWLAVDIAYVSTFARPITLSQMRTIRELKDMRLLQKGNRLSLFPISETHFNTLTTLADTPRKLGVGKKG